MQRSREIAGTPVRSASATWTAIAELIARTVAQGAALSRSDAERALTAAEPIGRILIAGGHLERHPITLVAGAVHCRITTVSGRPALDLDENLEPIPGAAKAKDFTIFLPAPAPLTSQVEGVADGHARLSAGTPPTHRAATSEAAPEPLVDRDALRRAVTRR